MIEFLNKYNLTVGKVVKAVFIVLGLIIVLAILAQVVKLPFGGGSTGGFGVQRRVRCHERSRLRRLGYVM